MAVFKFHNCFAIYYTVPFYACLSYSLPFPYSLFHSTPFSKLVILYFVKNTYARQLLLDLPTLLDLLNTTLFLKLILLFSRCFTYLVLLLPFWSLLVSFLSLSLSQNVYKQIIVSEKSALLSNKFGKYYKQHPLLGNLPKHIRFFYTS